MAKHSLQDNARRSSSTSSSQMNARLSQYKTGKYNVGTPDSLSPNRSQRASTGRTARHASPSAYAPQSQMGAWARDSAVIILAVAAVAIIAVLLFVFLRIMPPGEQPQAATDPDLYVSTINWENIDHTNNRYAYVVNGEVKSRLGIDVSENQHEIDWNAVAADGIDFAMIRLGYRGATEGGLYLDENYWTNLTGAKAAGIDCGVYFFSQAASVPEAVEEAEYVLEHLRGVSLDYPIAFDSEEGVLGLENPRTWGLDPDTMTAIAEAFCARVEAAGYKSMIYGNVYDVSRYHYSSMADDSIWWAEYDVDEPLDIMDIDMWQYSNGGEVAGIPTYVDMNIDLTRAQT